MGGGGVDGAIHAAAGPKLKEYCRCLGGCNTGQAKITPAFDLPCGFVIHTVGPVWQGGGRGEPGLLRRCYRQSLSQAEKQKLTSVAIPAISCGVYGYPIAQAVAEAVAEVSALSEQLQWVEQVIFVCFSADMESRYLTALAPV